MHFTSIILTTGLAISVNTAALPALFKQESSISFEPTGTSFPKPTSFPTGLPFPTGFSIPTGFPIPTGTGHSLPTGTSFPSPLTSDLSRLQQPKNKKIQSGSDIKSGTGIPSHTRGIHPTGTGGFASPSGGMGFGGGSARSSGKGSAHRSAGGGLGSAPTRTFEWGSSATGTSGKGYAFHSKNSIPVARRGWFL